jgi:Holliday junction resolvase RusA-like endonuclease
MWQVGYLGTEGRDKEDAVTDIHPRYSFWVEGVPTTQGSKSAVVGRDGKAHVIEAWKGGKVNAWRRLIAVTARNAGVEPAPKPEGKAGTPVRVAYSFHLPRPKKPVNPYPALDLDKLVRAAGDALKGIAWVDDSQIVQCEAVKRWADATGPGLSVDIEWLEDWD